jgi:D-2-hydroxyacid dehydrogenase (NADP+)
VPRIVLDMADMRPVWALPDWVASELRGALPADWELVVTDEATEGTGDGATRVAPAVLEAVREADAYLGFGIPEELLLAAPQLRWVHSGAAGVGRSLSPAMLKRPVIFTNSAGVHGPPIAETVLGMILFFGRGLDLAVAGKHRGEWWSEPFWADDSPMRELDGSVVGLIGFGGIAKEIARRVGSLGADVIALKRTAPGPREANLEPVPGGESLAGRIRLVHGTAGLEHVLDESDVLVITAPLTDETRGLIGAEALARLKPSAVVVNISRGQLIDEEALIRALSEGRLRGAGLDVFATEPLLTDSPLWKLPNVVLTPHVSGVTRGFWRRETDLILRNLRRLLDDAPIEQWENVVDKRAGY